MELRETVNLTKDFKAIDAVERVFKIDTETSKGEAAKALTHHVGLDQVSGGGHTVGVPTPS